MNRWLLPTVSVINWEIKVGWPLRSLIKKKAEGLDILEQEPTILPRQCVIVIGVSLNKTVLSGEDVILIRWNDSALPLKEEKTVRALLPHDLGSQRTVFSPGWPRSSMSSIEPCWQGYSLLSPSRIVKLGKNSHKTAGEERRVRKERKCFNKRAKKIILTCKIIPMHL